MIAGLDSSFSRPAPAVAVEARAAGVRLWSGYLATKGGVNLASPWDLASFDIARQVGGKPIAFCSGWDDPVACRNLAAQWDVRLCLDVETGIRGDGPWVQPFLDLSGAGLYGQHYQDTSGTWHSIHLNRTAAFHVMSWYIGHDPGATWIGPQPADGSPLGWQWQGDHQEFGLSVDRGWYDDWFGGDPMTQEQAAQLKWLYDQWSQVTLPDGTKTLRGYFGDIFNTVATLPAAKAELDALKAEVDKLAPTGTVDLSAVYARLDALSKHLGVGTP